MIIYKTTNLINNKCYVGQDYKNRLEYFGSGTILNKAIEKYGKENFKKEILEYCNNKNELNEKEIFWIKQLNSLSPNGYNITLGGDGGDTFSFQSEKRKKEIKKKRKETFTKKFGGAPNKGMKMSDEFKEKISLITKGRKYPNRKRIVLTEKHRKNISIANKGKKHSEETKQKLSQLKMGNKISSQTRIKISEKMKGNKNATGNKGNSKSCKLQTPKNEIINFDKKIELYSYIKELNLKLRKKYKINFKDLIRNGENKGYMIIG